MPETLLRIRNNYSPDSGNPPILPEGPAIYLGYFETARGKQWIFAFDRAEQEGWLYGGDLQFGWNARLPVVGGRVVGVRLSYEESAWLGACCRAATFDR